METKDPSGQRLRWWTQETANATDTPITSKPVTKASWYTQPMEQEVVPPPIIPHLAPPAPKELWEELEAEAEHRAALEAQAVRLQGNPREIIGVTRKRWAFTVLPTILFCSIIAIAIHSWSLVPMIAFLVAEIILLDWMVRSVYKKGSPSVSFSPLGMTLQMPSYSLGPIFWDEIQEIKVRRFIFGSYIEVKLKNHKATYSRALRAHDPSGKKQLWLIQKNKSLTLMDTMFGTPAKDIAAQIARFRPDLLETKKHR